MSNNYNSERESCQADCNCNSAPDPSLWNSPLRRRTFVKNTGAATAATMFAMNALKSDIVASGSGCPMLLRTTLRRIRVKAKGVGPYVTATGTGSSPGLAIQNAMAEFMNKIASGRSAEAELDPSYRFLNPSEVRQNVCIMSPPVCESSRAPEVAGYPMPPIDPPVFDPNTGLYAVTITSPVHAHGQMVITLTSTYGPCP